MSAYRVRYKVIPVSSKIILELDSTGPGEPQQLVVLTNLLLKNRKYAVPYKKQDRK